MENSDKISKNKNSLITKDESEAGEIIEKFDGTPNPATPNFISNNKKKFNEDNAMEMLDLDFKDLEDWLKRECKCLKNQVSDICETIRVDKFK